MAEIWNMDKDRLVYNEKYSDGILKKTVCNERLRTLYPEYNFISLEDGLTITCNWFYQNYENVRKN